MKSSYPRYVLLLLGFLLSSFTGGEKPDKNSLVDFAIKDRIQRFVDSYKSEVEQFGHITVIVRKDFSKLLLPTQVDGLPIIYKTEDEICEWTGKTGLEREALVVCQYKKTGKNEAFLLIATHRFEPAPIDNQHACRINLGGLECGGTGSIKRKYRNLTQYTYYTWKESTGWQDGGLDFY